MQITTKFGIGDTVWTIIKNKIAELNISEIFITIRKKEVKINYCFDKHGIGKINEENMFKTKEHLFEFLADNIESPKS